MFRILAAAPSSAGCGRVRATINIRIAVMFVRESGGLKVVLVLDWVTLYQSIAPYPMETFLWFGRRVMVWPGPSVL